ncbi:MULTISPECIES: hypothetical protein [Desulfosediminicola]|uniref:hypothetical protein n=1 Tax=Desulfosediminicola TaxID=2886823 RepID=UPI0010AB8A4C|nr:hypothetical protein [Desulfosediminicola ganghwensis]
MHWIPGTAAITRGGGKEPPFTIVFDQRSDGGGVGWHDSVSGSGEESYACDALQQGPLAGLQIYW